MSVLGLNSGCTVKYTGLTEGGPKGEDQGKYLLSRPNTDSVR